MITVYSFIHSFIQANAAVARKSAGGTAAWAAPGGGGMGGMGGGESKDMGGIGDIGGIGAGEVLSRD